MSQAIVTKYLGPTNTLGPRIKATTSAGSITEERDYHYNIYDDHARVAYKLAERLDWKGKWAGAGKTGNEFVFVRDAGYNTFTVE